MMKTINMIKNKKYEYKVLHKDLCSNNFDEEAFLSEMGDMGWKLVGVVATTHGKPTLYFRRKKTDRKISLRKKIVKKTTKQVITEERLPREIIMKRISEIIVDKLGVEEIDVKEEANFIDDLGCDSLDAVELLMDFEKEFNVAIPDEVAEKVRTVGDAVDLLYKLINGI
jgi:acyl carrier protein